MILANEGGIKENIKAIQEIGEKVVASITDF